MYPGATYMHFHDGSTCHGYPTLKQCLDEAVRRQWVGKVLQQIDVLPHGSVVKCYSLIVSSFDHHAKRGKFVAETYVAHRRLK